MRKQRSDSKLAALPEAQQAQLAEWLMGGMPYHLAAAQVEKEWGVSVGLKAFSNFWNEVCSPLLLARRQKFGAIATQRNQAIDKNPFQFSKATIDALEERALEYATRPDADPKKVKAIYSLVLKARDQELDKEHLTFDREKFTFDAAKACLAKLPELKSIAADPKLTDTARIDAVRRTLFGKLPEVSK